VARLVLGQAWGPSPAPAPRLSFDLAPELLDHGASTLSAGERSLVSGQAMAAFAWCAARFPLQLPDQDGLPSWAIQEITIGRGAHPGEYLTASSPQRPYNILVAAPWPLPSIYRLASLLVHEAMHQALYDRERRGPVARIGSLAYSPWRQKLRPGRLVWHALWTFSVQFVLLGDAVVSEGSELLSADPDLGAFLGEMAARLALCSQSLVDFDILDAVEADRAAQATALVIETANALEVACPGFTEARSRWLDLATREIDAWSATAFPVRAA
jgi:hypothetical protein